MSDGQALSFNWCKTMMSLRCVCNLITMTAILCWQLTAVGAQDITFIAECDQSPQRYVLIEPENLQSDMLIALHGHGSDRWQFATNDRDECRAARDIAREYDMLYVCPDYRAKTSWMGPKAEADMLQIIRDLKQQYRIKRVFVCGGSMGGTSALTFAAMHPDLVSGVAAMNGTANHLEYQKFQEAIRESFGGTKVEIPEEYKKRSAEYWPERFSMPVGLTTGGVDNVVPPQSVLRLAATLQELKRPVLLIHREQGGHSTTYEDAVEILQFVIKTARQSPSVRNNDAN